MRRTIIAGNPGVLAGVIVFSFFPPVTNISPTTTRGLSKNNSELLAITLNCKEIYIAIRVCIMCKINHWRRH